MDVIYKQEIEACHKGMIYGLWSLNVNLICCAIMKFLIGLFKLRLLRCTS
jgi:hypothetical protein